jgi:hypothetical protein
VWVVSGLARCPHTLVAGVAADVAGVVATVYPLASARLHTRGLNTSSFQFEVATGSVQAPS